MLVPEIKSIPEYAYDALVAEIRRFQERLSDAMEVGILANGAGLTIHVGGVRQSGHMVVFNGVDADGREARLIQHYTQIGVQMIAVAKLDSLARRIGF
jgi:hypothetical protein